MFKTALRSTLVVGAALAASVAMGVTASAATDDVDVPDVNVLNDACLLPWFWNGPFNVGVEDQFGTYVACNDYTEDAAAEEGDINVGNDLCVAPWFWNGPFNVLVGSQDNYYEACNG